jgi:UDP-glucuronate decarboxylase
MRPALNFEPDFNRISGALGPNLSKLRNKRILITGSTGLIGGAVCDFLVFLSRREPSIKVFAQSRSETRLIERFIEESDQLKFVVDDLNTINLDELAPNIVVHAASPASPKDYLSQPSALINLNFSFSLVALDYLSRNHESSFVFISSADIYGDPPARWIPTPEHFNGELDLRSPRSVYAQSKRIAEAISMHFSKISGVHVALPRPFNIYGPGQRVDDGRLVADFLRCGIEKRPIELRSDGSPSRAFCFITDAVDGIMRSWLIGKSGQPYNIGNDWDEKSVKELAEIASNVLNLPAPIMIPPPDYQSGSLSRCCPDLTLPRREIGFNPQIGFEEGLRRFAKCQN